MEELFKVIEGYEDKYIKFWYDICKFETNSRDKDGINRLNDYIEAFALSEGFEVERIPFEKAGDYMVIDLNNGTEKDYMFLAHLDTVFRNGDFGDDVVAVKDGKMYGPGVIDCKGGIAIALMTMRAFKDMGFDKNLRLFLVSDEEVNSAFSDNGIEHIKSCAKGYKGAFCCEVSKDGYALVGRKGISRYRVDVFGKSAHSGIAYFDGVNAVHEASEKICAIQKLSRRNGPTYSCNVIKAGSSFNIVPDKATFFIDVRFKNSQEEAETRENLERIAATDFIGGTKCDLTLISNRLPMVRTEDNEKLFEKIKNTAAKYKLEEFSPYESGGGSDAAYTVAAGVPTVCGIGATGDFCHTTEEYADISSLVRRSKVLAAVIKEN